MSQVLHLCMLIAERAVQVLPSCRRRRSFSAWWGRRKPRLSMQFSLSRCWAPQHHYPHVLPRRVELCPKSLISATTKIWKYMKILWVPVYQRKQHIIMLHLERYTSIHVSVAFEGLTSQLGQFMFISAPGVSLHFDLQTWDENARDTQEFNAVCGKHGPRFSTWSLKWKRPTETVMQFRYPPNPSTKGLLQLTRLHLFDPVCWFTMVYSQFGDSYIRTHTCIRCLGWFLNGPKASKEEQIMTRIALQTPPHFLKSLGINLESDTKTQKWTKIYTQN